MADGIKINGYIYVCLHCYPDGASINHDKFLNEFIDWIDSKGYVFEGVTKLGDMDLEEGE